VSGLIPDKTVRPTTEKSPDGLPPTPIEYGTVARTESICVPVPEAADTPFTVIVYAYELASNVMTQFMAVLIGQVMFVAGIPPPPIMPTT
jgi:hypothetical protein